MKHGCPIEGPTRTCVGCRDRDAQRQMLRWVCAAGANPRSAASLRPDPAGRLPGRGAYIHTERDCLERALKTGGFARSFRRRIAPATPQSLRAAIAASGGPCTFGEDQ